MNLIMIQHARLDAAINVLRLGMALAFALLMVNGQLSTANSLSSKRSKIDATSDRAMVCEHASTPLAVVSAHPLLGWRMSGQGQGLMQKAYRIVVSDREEDVKQGLGRLWDSGWVYDSRSIEIPYEGHTLQPGNIYFWRVQTLDSRGRKSWSSPSWWRQVAPQPVRCWIRGSEAGDRRDYQTSMWYRTAFDLKEKTAGKVFAEVGTPGYFELYINGHKVGQDRLSPSVAGRDQRTFYVTRDITSLIRPGRNVVGVWIGRGWYGEGSAPFFFHASLYRKDGSVMEVNTSADWRVKASDRATIGPWEWSQFGGEKVDGRLACPGWMSCRFDDSQWSHATVVAAPSPRLEPQSCELNRMDKPVKPHITKMDGPRHELDFGHNMTGQLSVTVTGLGRGDTVCIYYADRRWQSAVADTTPAGIVPGTPFDHTFPLKGHKVRYLVHGQMDMLIGSGRGRDSFSSLFNYHGFRYAILEGCPRKPQHAEACMIETDLRRTGSFTCSDELLNRMHEVDDRTMRCLNMGGIYVDCPTRERLGYGDGQVSVESSLMNYDMSRFYPKFARDWMLRQDAATGQMPYVAPNSQGGGGAGWPGLMASLCWHSYLYMGNRELLREGYEPMKRYLMYLESCCHDGIYEGVKEPINSIGDWLAPGWGMDSGKWPDREWNNFFNNCYRVLLWRTQRDAAEALGLRNDATLCQQKLDEMIPLIHRHYYHPAEGRYVADGQTYLVMPLLAGIAPDSIARRLRQRLMDDISRRGTLATGMLGTYFLLQYLQEQHLGDLAYRMIAHTRYPGWGYMLSQGATTWWEQWNGYWSQIHSCFTSLDGWMYQSLAGIRPLKDFPGGQCIRISPDFVEGLRYVKTTTETPYGVVKSSWKRRGKQVVMKVTLPPNSRALLESPKGYRMDRSGESLTLPSGHYTIHFNKK